MRAWQRISALSLLAIAGSQGQINHAIRLRSRVIDPVSEPSPILGGNQIASQVVGPGGGTDSRKRWLIQFEQAVQPETRMRMRNRGIRMLGAVPENAFLVSAPAGEAFDGLGVTWRGALEVGDKLSAATIETDGSHPGYLVFEFYQDADIDRARVLLVNAGVELKEHPDLQAWQLMGIASRDTAFQVAADESVLYVFPASRELIEGLPVSACKSALREDGVVAAIAAGVGDGWDGSGKGSATLTYSFGPMTGKLPEATVRTEVLRALAEWRKHAKVGFTETQRRTGERNIDIVFGAGAHGDPYPFDGRNGILAHTFYPAPPNSEPVAGDLHLDDAEPWDGAMDLFSVVLHELGHALGLGHSGDPTSVMYPFYRKVTELAQDDINSILQIYAAQDNSGGGGGVTPPEALNVTVDAVRTPVTAASVGLSGKVTGGQDPVSITWTTDAGALGAGRGMRDWAIAAVPLNLGSNRINVTALDGAGARHTRSVTVERRAETTVLPPVAAAPEIQFAEPLGDIATTAANVRVRGTATHVSGIQSVNWRNAKTGASGLAAGTGSWDLALVILQSGANAITVEVKARDGGIASKTITVTLASSTNNPPPPPPPTPTPTPQPSTPPTLSITSPASASYTTSAAQISITGTVRDNVAVTSVVWSTASGSGSASGTSNWSATVPLLVGINNVVIRAYDAAGNSSWRTISITRR